LDRNTSGVVVAGKTRAASGCLGRSLKNHEVTKRYAAILEGELPCDNLVHTIEASIYQPDQAGIKRSVGEAEGAAYAKTSYRVLAAKNGYSLVLCQPITGRTHQLRVHFSHIGHPILGDDLYGTPSPLIPRHALHALSLSVPMPFARMRPEVSEGAEPLIGIHPDLALNIPTPDGYLHTWAPLPEDMAELLAELFPDSLLATRVPTVALLTALQLNQA
jgi:23S rRNA-/tRNA-specific pseudouridylate synthase